MPKRKVNPMTTVENKTSIPTLSAEALRDVIGYSEENERIRQTLISGNYELDSFEGYLDAIYKRTAIVMARNMSDTYSGGSWEFNEHGLLSLITGTEKLEVDSSCRSHEVSVEEFAFIISVMASNHILWIKDLQNKIYSYFEYIYHLSSIITGEAKETDSYNTTTVYRVLNC